MPRVDIVTIWLVVELERLTITGIRPLRHMPH